MTNSAHDFPSPSDLTANDVQWALDRADAVLSELSGVYQGPERVGEMLLVALLTGGHVLLEGVPGVAKTTIVKAFARMIGGSFRRVQFTPDLLPGDITGTYVFDPARREFDLRPGPIFANVVLGDEINRAPAKTQSAMLEAMQEHQVTIDGRTHPLPDPFLVLATQNPVEQEGVYLLPEAQLDRFLLRVEMGYPTLEQELEMLARHGHGAPPVAQVVTAEEVRALMQLADRVQVSATASRYIVAVVRGTRRHPAVRLGASPRASLACLRAARARALMSGRTYVNADDVRSVAVAVLAHRILVLPAAAIARTTEADIVLAVLRETPWDPA